jgi:hypothetical protein
VRWGHTPRGGGGRRASSSLYEPWAGGEMRHTRFHAMSIVIARRSGPMGRPPSTRKLARTLAGGWSGAACPPTQRRRGRGGSRRVGVSVPRARGATAPARTPNPGKFFSGAGTCRSRPARSHPSGPRLAPGLSRTACTPSNQLRPSSLAGPVREPQGEPATASKAVTRSSLRRALAIGGAPISRPAAHGLFISDAPASACTSRSASWVLPPSPERIAEIMREAGLVDVR